MESRRAWSTARRAILVRHFFRLLSLVGIWASSLNCGLAIAAIPAISKTDAINFVVSLRDQNTKHLQEIDVALSRKVDETQTSAHLTGIASEIDKLRMERSEYSMRQDFLDRLVFQFDTYYDGRNLKDFLERALLGMTKVEVRSTSDKNLWKFLNYLSLAMKNIPDRQSEPLSFLEGYMKQSSIQNPQPPEEYLSGMAYSNGAQSEAAHPMDRTQVGEFAEKRLKQLQAQEMKAKAPSAAVTHP
jgi:hypothetical protein